MFKCFLEPYPPFAPFGTKSGAPPGRNQAPSCHAMRRTWMPTIWVETSRGSCPTTCSTSPRDLSQVTRRWFKRFAVEANLVNSCLVIHGLSWFGDSYGLSCLVIHGLSWSGTWFSFPSDDSTMLEPCDVPSVWADPVLSNFEPHQARSELTEPNQLPGDSSRIP